MEIVVDRSKCEGLGMCEAMAHEFFEVQDDGSMVVLDEQPGDEHRQTVSAAVDACPVLALALKG
ncbi:ferredoxin [Saccharopolyspora terrae]|uniref:Ferredoxin n=1 Tax=Saccharopolyspora terrae TaxID=2530384 RepID=A0A4R4VKY5_9PSEU|nr:ferredoxin [Saccharopolyspora terrae]TDD06399.1 ferredoxin [Saccharopolyspora terrae]